MLAYFTTPVNLFEIEFYPPIVEISTAIVSTVEKEKQAVDPYSL